MFYNILYFLGGVQLDSPGLSGPPSFSYVSCSTSEVCVYVYIYMKMKHKLFIYLPFCQIIK